MQGSERLPESYLYSMPRMRIVGMKKRDIEAEDFSGCFQPFVLADSQRARGLLRSDFVTVFRPQLRTSHVHVGSWSQVSSLAECAFFQST